MAKKILKTLVNNLGFKILAVVLAFILWLVVYNIDDPKKSKTFTTNVTVENASAVTDMNKCYEVLDGTNTVTFTVTGKRSELEKLDDTDFSAVADMNRLIINDKGNKASVPIEISAKRTYTSIVKKVDKVVATIDVDGMSSNLTDNVIPVLYDSDGNEVDTTQLKLSNTTVTISAKILSVKEVPLVFSTTGTPYGEYRVVEISSTPDTVKLKGASNVLNPLVSLEIPANVINVSGAREDVKTTIDISEYLPDGVELVDSSAASVTVTVRIEAYASRTYHLQTSDIRVNSLPDGLNLSFDKAQVSVTISGLQDDLNKLNASELAASIDASRLSEGTHQVELSLKLDEDHYAYQPITVSVTVKAKNTQDGDTSTDSGEDTGE